MVEHLQLTARHKSIRQDTKCANLISALNAKRNVEKLFGCQRHDVANLALYAFCLALKRLKSRKENPKKLTQLSSRSHPRHLVGKRTAQKDTIIDITSDSQVNSNFPYRRSPASLTFNNFFYLFLYLYIT